MPGAGRLAVVCGVALGVAIGAWQGWWVAYRGLPAFVVTLGGLMIFRGAAYLLTDGRTVAPLDPRFERLGGGIEGSMGASASWLLAALALAVIAGFAFRVRAERRRHGVPVPPRLTYQEGCEQVAQLADNTSIAALFSDCTWQIFRWNADRTRAYMPLGTLWIGAPLLLALLPRQGDDRGPAGPGSAPGPLGDGRDLARAVLAAGRRQPPLRHAPYCPP